MKRSKIILLFLILGPLAHAQGPAPKPTRVPETREQRRERMRAQMREQMKDSRRIIQQFLNDDMFTGLRQQFEQMMEQVENGQMDNFDNFFDDNAFEQIIRGQKGAFGNLSSGQSHWIETPKERVLVLKLPAAKDTPMDFKIEESRLTITGQIERRHPQGVSKHSFTKTYEIPADCDPSKAKFENKDGEILIKFPKRMAKNGRLPVKPENGDSTI